MDIAIRVTEFEPDDRLKVRAGEKVGHLEKYLPELERADIELSLEPTRGVEARRIARINLILKGKVLARAEARAADPYAAIDAAVETLKEQLLRYKEKLVDRRHNRLVARQLEREREGLVPMAEEVEEAGEEEEEEEEEAAGR